MVLKYSQKFYENTRGKLFHSSENTHPRYIFNKKHAAF